MKKKIVEKIEELKQEVIVGALIDDRSEYNCPECNGGGLKDDFHRCEKCNGTGKV